MSQSSPRKKQRFFVWIVVLLIMTASATHLLRTALRADENKAILTACVCFALFAIFKIGRARHGDTPPRTRLYIPLSTMPILLLAIWAANARLFGAFDVSSVLFHLKHSLSYDGVGDDIAEFAAYLTFAVIVITCLSYLAKRDRRAAFLERIAAVVLLLINPVTTYAYDRLLNPDRNELKLDQIYQPVEIAAPVDPPKNLILIYLESIEATYSEPVFENVFEDLSTLSNQGLRIDGVAQIQDTGWTIAGMVASQCGVPLLSYGLIMKNRMKNIETFLPNAECLATQLSNQGYQTRFYGGAPLNFAGKGQFLKLHGYQKTVGLEEIPPAERGEPGKWGIHDDRMFELAFAELERVAATEAPFLLSILTLGGHAPTGHPAPVCYEMFSDAQQMDRLLLSVACTARLTREFLEQARTRGLLEDTVVVMLSDHLAQKNSVTSRLEQFERENFVLILDESQPPRRLTKRGSMIDLYPTVLESLGLPTRTGQAGLGFSLLGAEPTLLETYGPKQLNLAIRTDKDLRERLWDLNAPPAPTAGTP